MTNLFFLICAFLTVLLIPGPSNALIANLAHQKGVRSSLKFIPVKYIGYVYAIGIWGLILHLTAPYWPAFDKILHFLSILYVLWLSFHLWKASDLQKHVHLNKKLSSATIFYSTLRNPKAVLFTTGILPSHTWDSPQYYFIAMLLLALTMIPASLFWIFFGRALLADKLIGLESKQLYKLSALLLMIMCSIPIIIKFFL